MISNVNSYVKQDVQGKKPRRRLYELSLGIPIGPPQRPGIELHRVVGLHAYLLKESLRMTHNVPSEKNLETKQNKNPKKRNRGPI